MAVISKTAGSLENIKRYRIKQQQQWNWACSAVEVPTGL